MIRINTLVYTAAVLALALMSVLFLTHTQPVHSEVNFSDTTADHSYQTFNFFTATTTNATSTNTGNGGGYFQVKGASDVIFYFSRGDSKGTGNSGSTRFNVQVTPDGVNWFDYNELGQVTVSSTGDSFWTRLGTTTLSGTTTQMWAMEDQSYYGVRCISVRNTDGDATSRAAATF